MQTGDLISLQQALAAVTTADEASRLLGALLTPKETVVLHHRWHAFQLALAGRKQREIRDELKVSIATASRAARVAREMSAVIVAIVQRAKLKAGGNNA